MKVTTNIQGTTGDLFSWVHVSEGPDYLSYNESGYSKSFIRNLTFKNVISKGVRNGASNWSVIPVSGQGYPDVTNSQTFLCDIDTIDLKGNGVITTGTSALIPYYQSRQVTVDVYSVPIKQGEEFSFQGVFFRYTNLADYNNSLYASNKVYQAGQTASMPGIELASNPQLVKIATFTCDFAALSNQNGTLERAALEARGLLTFTFDESGRDRVLVNFTYASTSQFIIQVVRETASTNLLSGVTSSYTVRETSPADYPFSATVMTLRADSLTFIRSGELDLMIGDQARIVNYVANGVEKLVNDDFVMR